MRQNDWRPTTAYGRAATREESRRRCGRTRRPFSATSRRRPIRPRPAWPIASSGRLAGSPASTGSAGSIRKGARLVPTRPRRRSGLSLWTGPGVAAMFFLAIALWPLGEVDRAISLIDRMQTRIADLAHVGTLAFGRMHAALFDLMRGDRTRAAPNAFELTASRASTSCPPGARMACFCRVGRLRASGAPAEGLEEMRRGAELMREQKILHFDGLLKIALAEVEARAGDPDRANAIIDEALATCDRVGFRARGGTASGARRNPGRARPANPARAEEAFLTAIAIAKRQATRSFGSRGARARQALSIDRPPGRSAHGPRAGARRLCADGGNAGDR